MNIHIPKDPEQTAHVAIAHYNPRLGEKFAHLIRFLNLHPESGPQRKGSAFPVGSVHYIELLAKRFADGRRGRKPKEPKTVPDNMVSVVLQDYFGCAPADLKRIQKEHRLSMGAENIIGDLLERYLADVLEPKGWVWCSGSTAKAIDFIKPPTTSDNIWTTLQVKNRSNTENSSSITVRNGTSIKHWHRTFSNKEKTNWAAFPDAELAPLLSENGFELFVRHYLFQAKTAPTPVSPNQTELSW